jgi:hypothetical protein
MPKRHHTSLRIPSVSVLTGSEQIVVHTPIELDIHNQSINYSGVPFTQVIQPPLMEYTRKFIRLHDN